LLSRTNARSPQDRRPVVAVAFIEMRMVGPLWQERRHVATVCR
jgi:hypothetical protein